MDSRFSITLHEQALNSSYLSADAHRGDLNIPLRGIESCGIVE